MTRDRTDYISLTLSVIIHLLIIIIMSVILVKPIPRQVALLTDVTLVGPQDYKGNPGEATGQVGLEEKQPQIPQPVEKKKNIKTAKVTAKKEKAAPDKKQLLKNIEKQKAGLDMGLSRENLREVSRQEEGFTDTTEEQTSGDEGITDGDVVAGGGPAISGGLSSRRYKSIDWKFPAKLPEETELAVEITVQANGVIKSVKLLRTSGYPELDRSALAQARKLQFDPLPADVASEETTGVLLFKFGARR